MKIAIVNTTNKKYGGNAYEIMVAEALSDKFDVELINTGVNCKGKLRYFEAPLVLWRLLQLNKRKGLDIVIRNFESSWLPSKEPTKNIALIHHVDSDKGSFLLSIIFTLLEKMTIKRVKNFAAVVTVSSYWKRFFEAKNYRNIYKIYNSFDLSEFSFTEEEIEDFKKRNNLIKKPIIYIGNAQAKKGVKESYDALKDLPVYLVTSGKPYVKIPAINLDLDRRDYLRLLKASSVVVAMSKFNEGWCRTAHEAMLSNTPVVGSGFGGMAELLEGGGQIICRDFTKLKSNVNLAMEHPEIGKKAYTFAKKFTIEDFKQNWNNLINSII